MTGTSKHWCYGGFDPRDAACQEDQEICPGCKELSEKIGEAASYLENKDFEKSREILETLVKKYPTSFYTHYQLAEYYKNKGEIKKAIEEYIVISKLNGAFEDRVETEHKIRSILSKPENLTKQGLQKILQLTREMNGTIDARNNKRILNNFSKIKKEIVALWNQDRLTDEYIINLFKRLKGTGAAPGLVSNLLFIKDRDNYNIFVPKTKNGLKSIGKYQPISSLMDGRNYLQFNTAANQLKNEEDLLPEAVDWLLWKLDKLKVTPETWDNKGTISIQSQSLFDSKLESLLLHKNQIIFYGPPGTGKTYTARKFAVEFIGGGDSIV